MQEGSRTYPSYSRTFITFSTHCGHTRLHLVNLFWSPYSHSFYFLVLLDLPHYVVSSAFQARATLIHILELQIHRRKQAVEDIKRYAPSNPKRVFAKYLRTECLRST